MKMLLEWLLATFLYIYLRLVWLTSRKTYHGRQALDEAITTQKPIVLMFWHGRLAMMPFLMRFKPKGTKAYVMISRHGDGRLIARIIHWFGLRTIRGSSNRPASDPKGAKDRGGATALREIRNVLQSGNILAITPDGPRGPRMRLKPNSLPIIVSEQPTILLVSAASTCTKRFKSWDRFNLPLPFGHIMYHFDTFVPGDTDVESTGVHIENRLNTLTYDVDTATGNEPITPAD